MLIQQLLSLDLTFTDLSAANATFYDRGLPHLSKEELFEALKPPRTHNLVRTDDKPLEKGIPNQLVASTQWMGWPLWNSEDYDAIRIIDLGSAFQENSPPNGLAQARDLTAPETIFTDKFGCKQDLWCVGLLVSILLSI